MPRDWDPSPVARIWSRGIVWAWLTVAMIVIAVLLTESYCFRGGDVCHHSWPIAVLGLAATWGLVYVSTWVVLVVWSVIRQARRKVHHAAP